MANGNNQQNAENNAEKKAKWFLLGECCFILLPFLIITIALGSHNSWNEIIKVPEWSIVASVLFGQLIIKILHTGVKTAPLMNLNFYAISGFMALLILFGLAPSLTLLVIILIVDKSTIPYWIYYAQIFLLLISGLSSVIINALEVYMNEEENH